MAASGAKQLTSGAAVRKFEDGERDSALTHTLSLSFCTRATMAARIEEDVATMKCMYAPRHKDDRVHASTG